MGIYDFHTHTFLSDGVLSPMELIRRAYDKGYSAIAITDHVGMATQERVVSVLVEECAQAMAKWDIIAIPGVEITHGGPGEAPGRETSIGTWRNHCGAGRAWDQRFGCELA